MISRRNARKKASWIVLVALGTALVSAINVNAETLPQAAYAAVSDPANGVRFSDPETVAPGVIYRTFQLTTSHGSASGHLVNVDLRNPKVSLELLHPDAVAKKDRISQMVGRQGAVAGVNGDFFNVSETHAGVAPTNSAVGPEITGGESLKFAVPNKQRFGPKLPDGTSTRDVFGLGVDGRARVSSLALDGELKTKDGRIAINGLNQYALPQGGIGVYNHDWGTASRVRPTCGSDASRSAPCSAETKEVTVRNSVVISVYSQPGAGAIPNDTVVLVGREQGAAILGQLQPGDKVKVSYRLVAEDHPRFLFAVGGFPILRNGQLLTGMDDPALAPRTSAGVSADGKQVYLAVVDGRTANSVGMTVSELAVLMQTFGAANAVNLDGGGSSTLVTRQPKAPAATVRNAPSDGSERAVANGIGVFVRD